jgi:hypothetical protein
MQSPSGDSLSKLPSVFADSEENLPRPYLQAQQLPLLGLKVLVTDDALVAQGGQLLQFSGPEDGA